MLTAAVVGAGPAGIYLADALTRRTDQEWAVDVYDRLPTPFGLLRYGVAPDHLKIKGLAVPLQHVLDHERVRFVGNVEVGRDVTVEELRERYSAVVYTYGAAVDRTLGVPGEDLTGSTSAAAFVWWYSGHPDAEIAHDVATSTSVVVVGAGNVAVDVVRILTKDVDELATTDLPDEVVDALRTSGIRDVHVLARRGPAHAKWTSKELRELGELTGVDVVLDPADLELDDEQQALVDSDRNAQRNVETLRLWAQRETGAAPRRIHLHFWCRPECLEGADAVEAVLVVPTRPDPSGTTAAPVRLPAQLVVRCVGYLGTALPGVPFDPETGTVPTDDHRVVREGSVSPGEYAAGWISRGPVGVVGSNRSNAKDVVEVMVGDDLHDAEPWDVETVLRERGVAVVGHLGWGAIDAAERTRGGLTGRDRVKLATWADLLDAAAGH